MKLLNKANIGRRAAIAAQLQRAAGSALEKAMTAETWAKIAKLHASDASLDAGSQALILEHNPALQATKLTYSKALVETPLMKMVFAFQQSIAEDTVRNEYTFHRQIHEWLADGKPVVVDVDGFNERVYAELFLTPRSDPWLGLAPNDVYTALENNGVTGVVK